MKKFYILSGLMFLCAIGCTQSNNYDVLPYSTYVPDTLTYPILIPDNSTSVAVYTLKEDVSRIYSDTIKCHESFNIRLNCVEDLSWFSLFNKSEINNIEIINWIGIFPDGNSNLLLIMDRDGKCCRYTISDDSGKVHLRGDLKKGVSAESLIDIPNGIYYLEIVSCDKKMVYEFQISTNNF